MATIGDVAKTAGLSEATVSRVINNHPYVSAEKKQLVFRTMDQLGYVPNSIAQQLRNQQVSTIAVLIPRISNPFFSRLVEAMEEEAARHQFQLIVCQTRTNPERELVYLDWLKTKQIGGVILASSENDWDVIQDYQKYGPMMFCNEYPANADVPIVSLNQYQAGYMGTQHLLAKGHEKIAYCYGSEHDTNMANRKIGYLDALQEQGCTVSDNLFFQNAFDIDDGVAICREILAMSHRPTAVFTGSDEVAAGIIKEAKNKKLTFQLSLLF